MNYLKRFKAPEGERGFSLIEVLVATLLSIGISGAVLSVVAIGMRLSADNQLNAVNDVKVQKTLTAFSKDVRDANNIVAPLTVNTMSFDIKRLNSCERQTYLLQPDSNDSTRLQLRQTVRKITLNGNEDCSDLGNQLSSGATTTWVDVNDLGTNSSFRYFNKSGVEANASSFVASQNPDCVTATNYFPTLGSIKLILDTAKSGGGTVGNSLNEIQTAPRALTMGVSCS